MEAHKYSIKRQIIMKKVINKSLKVIGILMVLFLFLGCEKDEFPCEKVAQGDFILVE
jgi:hypothetical protein